MGIDLTLCPFRHHPGPWTWHLAYDRLSLQRDYDLFAQIDEKMGRSEMKVKAVCKPKPVPKSVRFSWYDDDGIKDLNKNPYGDALVYVDAGEIAKVKTDKCSPYNKAIFAMIRVLDHETPIVLWWC